MVIDFKTLAMANLAVQIVLIIAVFGAVYLARKKKVVRHCTVIRIAVPVQILAILLVMLPSMLGLIGDGPPLPFFYPEMLIHHSLGLAVVGLWVYINLGIERRVKMPRNRAAVMWLALGVWIASIVLGLSMYYTLYT